MNHRPITHRIAHRFDKLSKESKLLGFFSVLIGILRIRLLVLQIVDASQYQTHLIDIHATKSTLEAKRGNIYIVNKGGKMMKLTENIDYYRIFVDPQFVTDKAKLIEVLKPIVYEHLCILHGIDKPNKLTCLKNLQDFTRKQILPIQPQFFYQTGTDPKDTGANLQLQERYTNVYIVQQSQYDQSLSGILQTYTTGQIDSMIATRLDEMIH